MIFATRRSKPTGRDPGLHLHAGGEPPFKGGAAFVTAAPALARPPEPEGSRPFTWLFLRPTSLLAQAGKPRRRAKD